MKANCTDCRTEMKIRSSTPARPYRFTVSGLDNIRLIGIPLLTCPACGTEDVVFPRLEELLGAIAEILLKKDVPLVGSEARYLRKFACHSAQDFARLLGVTPQHLSRLENGAKPLAPTLDKLSRALVAATLNNGVKDILLCSAKKPRVTSKLARLAWKKDHWESAA